MYKVVLIGVAAAMGCAQSWPDTPVCQVSEYVKKGRVQHNDSVDVLLVIDDGPSMAQEQALLAREFPRLVDLLLNGGRHDTDYFWPIQSLRAGVTGCDGVLRSSVACGTADQPYVWHFAGFHDSAASLAKFTCNARVGADGCALAPTLQAALDAAATPGFRRSNSLLLVIIVTDKDDASAMENIQSYVEKFDALGEPLPLVAIVAGLPPDLDRAGFQQWELRYESEREAYYASVLSDPRLAQGAVSCTSSEATAQAPRRLIEFARALGDRATVQSICREDVWRGLYQLVGRILHSQSPRFGYVPEHVTPASGG